MKVRLAVATFPIYIAMVGAVVEVSAAPAEGELRRDCSELARKAPSPQDPEATKACLVWVKRQGKELTTILVENAAGVIKEWATREPTYPWADIHLLPRTGSSQWLTVVYKSEGDRSDGKAFFVEVHSVDTKRKVFEAYCAGVEVKDLNGDGRFELVLDQVLSPTRYDIQLGWPTVYVLSDVISGAQLESYPVLISSFLGRAEDLQSRLNDICSHAARPPCPYTTDIELVAAQITLARALQSRVPLGGDID